MTREANEIRRNEPDENDDKSIKDGYRRDFINKLTLIMIIAFVFGLIIFVRVFVAH